MEIRMANESDIESWMSLVRKVKDYFPGLETPAALDEHRDTVLSVSIIAQGQRVRG